MVRLHNLRDELNNKPKYATNSKPCPATFAYISKRCCPENAAPQHGRISRYHATSHSRVREKKHNDKGQRHAAA